MLRIESHRTFMASACLAGDELLEVDMVKAFPSGDTDDSQVYIAQPPGFEVPGMVAGLLLKPLEGTKQAGNLQMAGNAKSITNLGFKRCVCEPNV